MQVSPSHFLPPSPRGCLAASRARAGGRHDATQHCRRRVTVAEPGSDVPSMSDSLACLGWFVSPCLALALLSPAGFSGDVSTICSFPAWLFSALDRHTSGSDRERGWGGEERCPRVGNVPPFFRLNHVVFVSTLGRQ